MSQLRWKYRVDVKDLYKRLGFLSEKIPADYSDSKSMRVRFCGFGFATEAELRVTVVAAVKGRHPNGLPCKSSKHRIFVDCPRCTARVPAGRLHQHIGARTTCIPFS